MVCGIHMGCVQGEGREQLVICYNARDPEGLSLLGEKSGEGLWAGYLVFWHAWPVEPLFSKCYRNYKDALKTQCAAWNRASYHIHWFIEHQLRLSADSSAFCFGFNSFISGITYEQMWGEPF